MFVHVTAKLGNMRKAVDFLIVPTAGDEIIIQSDRRIARVNLETRKAMLSDGKGGTYGNSFMYLQPALGAKMVDVPQSLIDDIKTKLERHPSLRSGSTLLIG